jgi:hypothetical protein
MGDAPRLGHMPLSRDKYALFFGFKQKIPGVPRLWLW